ncbi:metal ABC transporter ATP-binding protein [Pyrobaculum neutrophilum]|uniref:ABC transporter related n=1 Tax=Pyrobaculum neutrophilum (strain DSM 2338 / JCM 9278 / NBRC 100436 / V24Sta) TaxID=444157 RepID=B1YB84_PYRNV|nr:metal ABC transporter ATP-binding protein [Pyrobaculum neutrophilum]ACB39215.1 ABC transporter related [Pyrobaculum neutrophilum V24Sta]
MSLVVKNVTVLRGGRPAVEDISFSAEREFVLVAGPNGAGKTTLYMAILGLLPHRGEICVEGVCGAERARKIGYVPQVIRVEAQATVWEYVYLPARFRGVKEAKRAAEEALAAVGLTHLRDRPLGSLSGGQLQRAAIARALAVGGDVLLLDEPLANVDPQGRIELLALLRELKRGRTVLMTSHELTLPTNLADKILLLNRRLIAYGPPEEVLREEVLSRVYRYVRIAKTPAGYICVTEDYAHPH